MVWSRCPYCCNCRRAWTALHCTRTQECVGCQKGMHVFCCVVSYANSHTLHTCAPGYNAGVAFAFTLVLVDMQHRLRLVWAVTISPKVSLPLNVLCQIPNLLPNKSLLTDPKGGSLSCISMRTSANAKSIQNLSKIQRYTYLIHGKLSSGLTFQNFYQWCPPSTHLGGLRSPVHSPWGQGLVQWHESLPVDEYSNSR